MGAVAGPVLFCRGVAEDRLRLTALLVCPAQATPPTLLPDDRDPVAPELLLETLHNRVDAYPFDLPLSGNTGYRLGSDEYAVNAAWGGDLRIAYIACNGMEEGEDRRELQERNLLWRRLAAGHQRQPLHLLLHGGDQLYADEARHLHPALERWADLAIKPDPAAPFTQDMRRLLCNYFIQRYVDLYRQPAIASLLARVPSLMMWDDHDIRDGWGSFDQARLDVPIGRGLFAAAREAFMLFQLGVAPDAPPANCADPNGATLTWSAHFPGLDVIAPDLRSERRPRRIMGEAGWHAFEKALADSKAERVLLLSSTPALGPRLSWIEAAMAVIPHPQTYEDDLRDQWQSRAHREEWQRLLRCLLARHAQGPITLLSGEIHLATRGEMRAQDGSVIHQLVASGIAHPPPPWAFARCLGALARCGSAPLEQHPIRLSPLPGQRGIYCPQRNYLMLERRSGDWRAWWELEQGGATPALSLS